MGQKTSIENRNALKKYYQDKECAERYLEKRFAFPLGRILHEKQITTINSYISSGKIQTILELACGPGRLTSDLELSVLEKGIAVDASAEMLNIAQKRLSKIDIEGKWILKQEDIFVMDLKEKFDLVYTFRFIRHLKRKDRSKIYKVVKRHLKDKGLFIFDVVNKDVSLPLRLREGEDNYPVYDKLFTRAEFLNEMEEENFVVRRLIPVYPYYNLLSKIQIYLGPRVPQLTYRILKYIEFNFRNKNLEWIAICQLQ